MSESGLSSQLWLTSSMASADHPFAAYADLRAVGRPVCSDTRRAWILASYDDVTRGLSDHRVFTSTQGVGCDGPADPPSLLDLDPPEHEAQRRIVAPWFTRKACADVGETMRSVIERLVMAVPMGKGTDLMPTLFDRLAIAVLSVLLGFPARDFDVLRRCVVDILLDTPSAGAALTRIARLTGGLPAAPSGLTARIRGTGQEQEWLLSMLLGGQETLSSLAAEVVRTLATDPPPTETVSLIDEVARLASPTQFMFRTVRQATTVSGVELPAGSRVLLLIAAANRDPARFPEPDGLRPGRTGWRPLSFGVGAHACLGRWLARTGIATTVDLIRRHRPGILTARLEPRWAFSGNVRCLTSLVVS